MIGLNIGDVGDSSKLVSLISVSRGRSPSHPSLEIIMSKMNVEVSKVQMNFAAKRSPVGPLGRRGFK